MLAARASRVMFVSEDSAQWIGDSIGLPERKRSVIHHGMDPSPWRGTVATTELDGRPYMLSVSSIYPYKNYVRLIEAYAELAERRLDLWRRRKSATPAERETLDAWTDPVLAAAVKALGK